MRCDGCGEGGGDGEGGDWRVAFATENRKLVSISNETFSNFFTSLFRIQYFQT